jgi:hypothetical protein
MPLTAARTLGLKSLFIAAYNGYGPFPPVLNFLALPKLRRLDLHHNPQFAVLASFLARSPCVLDHLGLTIGAENETRQKLPDILRTFPSLASLDIHAGSDIMTIMYLLSCTSAVAGAPRDIVPELKTLTITTWNKDFDYEYLLRFLRLCRDSKSYPVVLESFHLKICEDEGDRLYGLPSLCVFSALEQITAQGLNIVVSTRTQRVGRKNAVIWVRLCIFCNNYGGLISPRSL